jgi:hypothetical protein
MHLLAALILIATPAEDATARLVKEQAELRAQLLAACPAQRASIERLAGAAPDQRVALLRPLETCAAKVEPYFVSLGNALNQAASWPEAEAAFRKAMALRVTEAAQLGLLTSLVRQKTLTTAQQADLDANLDYFRQRTCTRADLCAGLSWVAWHVDDVELVKRAAARAISLGFAGWQPYFAAGTVYAGTTTERSRAVDLLREAKRRGGPAKSIDDFLFRLGADAGL